MELFQFSDARTKKIRVLDLLTAAAQLQAVIQFQEGGTLGEPSPYASAFDASRSAFEAVSRALQCREDRDEAGFTFWKAVWDYLTRPASMSGEEWLLQHTVRGAVSMALINTIDEWLFYHPNAGPDPAKEEEYSRFPADPFDAEKTEPAPCIISVEPEEARQLQQATGAVNSLGTCFPNARTPGPPPVG